MDVPTIGIILAVGVGATLLVVYLGRVLSRGTTAPVATVPAEQTPEAAAPQPVQSVDESASQERRIAPRRKGSAVSVLVTDEERTEPYRAWVIDRSTTGLCLELEESKKPGQILQLKPAEAPQATAWIPAEVRYSRQKGNVYHVGCQFLQTPSWNVLLLFG